MRLGLDVGCAGVLLRAEGDHGGGAKGGPAFGRRFVRPALHLVLLQRNRSVGDLGFRRPSIKFRQNGRNLNLDRSGNGPMSPIEMK